MVVIIKIVLSVWSIVQYPTSITTERNATGHVVCVDGVQTHMIEALSQMLNFRLVKLSWQIANKIYIIIRIILLYLVIATYPSP